MFFNFPNTLQLVWWKTFLLFKNNFLWFFFLFSGSTSTKSIASKHSLAFSSFASPIFFKGKEFDQKNVLYWLAVTSFTRVTDSFRLQAFRHQRSWQERRVVGEANPKSNEDNELFMIQGDVEKFSNQFVSFFAMFLGNFYLPYFANKQGWLIKNVTWHEVKSFSRASFLKRKKKINENELWKAFEISFQSFSNGFSKAFKMSFKMDFKWDHSNSIRMSF